MKGSSFSNKSYSRASLAEEGDLEQLRKHLQNLHIREAQDRQKLISTRKTNEKLREDLNALKAHTSQLEKAREINQGFFHLNDKKLTTLKKEIDKEPAPMNLGVKGELETLLSRIRTIQEDHRDSINYYLKSPPNIPVDEDTDKFVQVLKGQIDLFHHQLAQREQAHEALQERYTQSWQALNEEVTTVVAETKKLLAERKQDLQTISELERKKSMLEAGLNLQPESVNAHELAMNYANNVIVKIQDTDANHELDTLTKKLRRNLRNKVAK